jgi:hypothetical protein
MEEETQSLARLPFKIINEKVFIFIMLLLA